jgi:hypothetical protein
MNNPVAKWVAVAALILGALLPTSIFAHGGGTPRLTSAEAGPYRLYAWTEPEPWRVGEAHLSIAVTKPNPDATSTQVELPVTDAAVEVTFSPTADPSAAIVVQGTHQTLLENIYYEADTVLPSAGEWTVTITARGAEGTGEAGFTLEALPPRAVNWTLVGAAGGVLVVLLAVMAIWSRAQQPAPAPTPRRPRRAERG